MSVRAAGGNADDQAHRPRRIGLRPRDARHGRQRGSARCQMQKLSAGKFHWVLPNLYVEAGRMQLDGNSDRACFFYSWKVLFYDN